MRKEIKILIFLLVCCFSYTTINAQDFPNFKIEEKDGAFLITPNFVKTPDMPNRLYPENREGYSKAAFINKFPSLFEKVESRLDVKDILVVRFNFNDKGEVIYISFLTWKNDILPKLTDELLLEIYNSFKTVKVDKIVDQWKEDISGKMGTLETFFKGKSN